MIRWEVGEMVRCDIVAYGGRNLSGKKTRMRLFPTGSQQGQILTQDMRSLFIRAPAGIRVTFIASPGEGWENRPWRSVVISKESSFQSAKSKRLRAVYVPDLDCLDEWSAKVTRAEGTSGYAHASSPENGLGWTFGLHQDDGLKGKVELIRVERMGAIPASTGTPVERPPTGALEIAAYIGSVLQTPGSLDSDALKVRLHESFLAYLIAHGMSETGAHEFASNATRQG